MVKTVIIPLNTIHSFAHSQMVLIIAMLKQYFNLDTQLKGFQNCNLTLIILFNITHLFAQLNGSKFSTLTVLFVHS